MLQKLNERIQGIIAWVVVILIALTFTLFGIDYYMQSRQISDAEVTVNNESITKQSYEVNYRRIRQQHQYEQISASKEKALKKQILQDMIFNLITVQAAGRDGFLVTPEQANSAIVNIPQFQQDGQFSAARYQQALSAALYTPDSFRNQVRQGMLLNQQRFAFIGSAFALPNEIAQFVKLYMQTRDYDYLIIPKQQFLSQVQVSQPDIATYYIQHKEDFLEPEKVSIDYVTLSINQIKKDVHITDADVLRYYQENETNFLTPTQWKVQSISFDIPTDAGYDVQSQQKQKADDVYHMLLKKPEQFDRYFKSNHQTTDQHGKTVSASVEHESDWIVAGTTDQDKVLSTLTTPGEISAPLKTSTGYQIFKLIAYKKPETKPFAEVSAQIKEQLTSEAIQSRYAQALEQLTDLSYQTPDSLTPVADALKLSIHQSPLFRRDGGTDPISKNKQIINAAFSHDVLDLGNNSEPIQIDNDSVIVLRIHQHIPSEQKKLAEVEAKIKEKLTDLEAGVLAKNFGAEVVSVVDPNQEKELLKNHQIVWKPVINAARDTDQTNPLITELAFNLPHINNRSGRSLENGDYVVVLLKKVSEGDYQSLDNEQQESLIQQIQASYGAMDYDLYINSLVNQAKIVHE